MNERMKRLSQMTNWSTTSVMVRTKSSKRTKNSWRSTDNNKNSEISHFLRRYSPHYCQSSSQFVVTSRELLLSLRYHFIENYMNLAKWSTGVNEEIGTVALAAD